MKAFSIETEDSIEQTSIYHNFQFLNYIKNAEENYIVMRCLIPNNFLFPTKIVANGAEGLEKIFKAYILIKQIKSPEFVSENYRNHNLEKLREECATRDDFFHDETLEEFCRNYSNKERKIYGNNVMRHGFDKNTKSYGINLSELISLFDKFILGTFIRLDDFGFNAYTSQIAMLLLPNHTLRLPDNMINVENIKHLLENNNNHISGFLNHCAIFGENLR